MFPSSAILEEIFPSDGDGNKIKGRYAISANMHFNRRKGSVAAFSGDRGSIGEKELLRHFLESGVQMEIGVEDYIRDEVLRIIFCSCVTLGFG